MVRYLRFTGVLLLFTLLLQGCSTTLQSGWRDFNAYFNTYYNAKTSFERGIELQEQQDITINPERPLRIHRTPRQAGQSQFEHAIQKSADVIRFHPQSRWVDNAIEIIGISEFYLQQYFSADQKMGELLSATSDPELIQSAVLWRGRAALELGNHLEGINYIQSRFEASGFEWDRELKAEIKLIIAQLHVARKEYEEAEGYLSEALPDVRNTEMEMRARFLHGQLLEILERYDEAFEAYKRATHRSNPSYDLIYHAELKQGIVARKRGDIDWAYDHFTSMSRDDRHFRYIATIEYEIARTLQEESQFTQARELYRQILRRRTQRPSDEVQAKIYYGLADIYRDNFLDYSMAAAYYDSAAAKATNPDLLPLEFDASHMSRSYGEYSRMRKEINRLDSLLWLANLSEAEFDSVIAEVREQRRAEMEAQEREQRRQRMVSVDDIEQAGTQADEHTENGFLNHKNHQLMLQNSQAFQAYWGARPLVDDWRRMEAVRANIVRQFEEEGEEVDDIDEAIERAVASEVEGVEIDFSEIPFTEEEQLEIRQRIASYEYEIGNVFFLSLVKPDSAANNYRSVMRHYPDSDIAAQAMYSLSELYHSVGDSVQALQYAMQLVDFHPNTIYAERMSDRYMLEFEKPDVAMSREDSISLAYNQAMSYDDPVKRAGKLRQFARVYPDTEMAPMALYRSAQHYIEAAREDEHYRYRLSDLTLVQTIWEQEKDEMETFRDSVRALLADSVYMETVIRLDAEMDTIPEAEAETGELPDRETDELPDAEVNNDAEAAEAEQNTALDADKESNPSTAADADGEMQQGNREKRPESVVASLDDDTLSEVTETGKSDTTAVTEEPPDIKTTKMHLQEIVESEIQEPDFSDFFPYEGALWDSARVVLVIMRDEYQGFPKNHVVNELAREIEADRILSEMIDTEKIYSCEELDERPEPEGGMEQFLAVSGLQKMISEYKITGTLVVEVLIDQDGVPLEVHFNKEMTEIQRERAGNKEVDGEGERRMDEEEVAEEVEEPEAVEKEAGDPEAAGEETGEQEKDVQQEEMIEEEVEEPERQQSPEEDEAELMEVFLKGAEQHLRFSPPLVSGQNVQATCEYTIVLDPRE